MKKEGISIFNINRKSQSWYLDFLVAFLVIVIILIIFYKTLTAISTNQQVLNDLSKDSITITNLLISPVDVGDWWTKDCDYFRGMKTFGLTDDGDNYEKKSNVINNQKLNKVIECVSSAIPTKEENYQNSRYQLGSRLDYYVYFKERETKKVGESKIPLLQINGQFGFGHPDLITISTEEDLFNKINEISLTRNIAKISRLVHYNNKFVTMGVILWQ